MKSLLSKETRPFHLQDFQESFLRQLLHSKRYLGLKITNVNFLNTVSKLQP